MFELVVYPAHRHGEGGIGPDSTHERLDELCILLLLLNVLSRS